MMKKGGDAQNRAIQHLWKVTHSRCQQVIRKGRGSEEDQKDVRQEASMLLYLAINQGKFRGNTDAELIAFFKQTFLFVWLDKVRKRDKMPLAELEGYTSSIDASVEEMLIKLEEESKSNRALENCLKKLDEKEKDIVKWRYFDIPPASWDAIAKRLSYQTAQAAQNKGGRGMKKLRICMGT